MSQTIDKSSMDAAAARWQGGVSPFAVSWQKMMMWWFIVTDALLFAGFLAAYGFNRLAAGRWPVQAEVFDLRLITVMTFVLISSSATMATAVGAARKGDLRLASRFTWATILGGVTFLGMQAYEWSHMIHAGATLTFCPAEWNGPADFCAFFYLITGFHGTHVLIGTIILLCTGLRSVAGKSTAGGVELAGLYWHFVDLVWVFVFGCFYLV